MLAPPLTFALALALALLWCWRCWRRSVQRGPQRQLYRQRAGLLLILCALLAVSDLHSGSLTHWWLSVAW